MNLVFVFLSWKKRRFYSLVPAATYIIAFTLFTGLAIAGTNYMLKGTLYRPNSFFDETRKKEFTEIATRVLKAKQDNILRPDTYAGLKKYDMKLLFLDTNEQLVEFGQFHSHVWFEYIYSKYGITNLPYVDDYPIQLNLGNGWYFRNW
ncbi:MAG TPA: hypothetical protein VK742_19240 [Candidatus Sulfotelmatobacter sp.]|nr:hypothetical protein [Candidatus Sulfotelmatobacter sp.]